MTSNNWKSIKMPSDELREKFTSGNGVPVERARVTINEFRRVDEQINNLEQAILEAAAQLEMLGEPVAAMSTRQAAGIEECEE